MPRQLMPKSGALMPHVVMSRDAAVAGVFSVDGDAGSIDLTGKYLQISNYNTEREELEIILTGKADAGINTNIKELTGLTEPLSISQGGTGGNTPITARRALGAIASVNGVGPDSTTGNVNVDLSGKADNGANSDITSLSGLTTALSKTQGGTGLTAPFGATSGTFCQGNDARLGTLDGKTGGGVSTDINILNGARIYLSPGGDRSSDVFIYRTSSGITFAGDANLPVDAGYGFRCRQGRAGATSTNVFSFFWSTSSVLQAWVDTSNVGNVTLTSTSDRLLKKDIKYQDSYEDSLAEVARWRPSVFKYKARGVIEESEELLGFIANDLVEVSPECVKGTGLKEGYDENNPEGAYSLDQVAMIAKLTGAIIALNEKLEQRDTAITEMQRRLQVLEDLNA